jgi:outer membrane protein assembly factor BamB
VNNVVYVGTGETHVLALNAQTGALIWSTPTDGSVSVSPALANGILYIASNTSYSSGSVEALNAANGALIWKTGVGGASPPIVANGVVYVGTVNHAVYALNAGTGALLWSYTTGNSITSTPAVVNGILYVTSEDYNLYAFSLPGH